MARIRVFHFIEAGDTSGFFPQIARWHDRDRYQCTFGTLYSVDPGLEDVLRSAGADVWSGGAAHKRDFPAVAHRLRKRLAGQADVLHTHLFEPSLVGLAVGRTLPLPTVSTRHHSNYHARMGKRIHVQLDRLATRMSDVVIAVSEHTAQVMIEDEHADPSRIRTVLNGIDAERIRVSDEADLRALRTGLDGGDDSVRLILHPARFHPEKGHHDLFEAIALIGREGRFDARLLLAGTGPAREEYEARVRALGIEDRVRFLGFRDDIHDLMAVADTVVLPSRAEAFGLALLETLYVGTPVVATDIGGIPEIVHSLGAGTLVPAADPTALAAAIESSVESPRLPPERQNAVRDEIERRFSFRRLMAEYEEIYSELLARPASGRAGWRGRSGRG